MTSPTLPVHANGALPTTLGTPHTATTQTPASSPEQLQQLKTELRDIRLPDPIGWWPPAPGWWALVLTPPLILLGLYLLCRPLIQRWRFKRYTRSHIAAARKAFSQTQATAPAIRACSELLRRVCLTYFPRSRVAGLSGQAWLNFLNAHSRKACFTSSSEALLREARFQSEPPTTESVVQLFNDTEKWIERFSPQSHLHVKTKDQKDDIPTADHSPTEGRAS